MQKITVMVPIEVEVSVHPAGNIRVHSATWPNFDVIEGQLEVLRKEDCPDYMKFVAIVDGWVIRKKQ